MRRKTIGHPSSGNPSPTNSTQTPQRRGPGAPGQRETSDALVDQPKLTRARFLACALR
jgi:hypothetical protein